MINQKYSAFMKDQENVEKSTSKRKIELGVLQKAVDKNLQSLTASHVTNADNEFALIIDLEKNIVVLVDLHRSL